MLGFFKGSSVQMWLNTKKNILVARDVRIFQREFGADVAKHKKSILVARDVRIFQRGFGADVAKHKKNIFSGAKY